MSDLFRLLPPKRLEHLKKLIIKYDKRSVKLTLICYQKDSISLTMDYQQLGPDTKVTNNRDETEYLAEDDDFVSVFCRDLEKILVGRPKLEQVSIYCYLRTSADVADLDLSLEYEMTYLNPVRTRILKELSNILRITGPEKLKAERVRFESENVDVLTELLSCFDPDFLIHAHIKVENDDLLTNIDPLWALDLWKVKKPSKVKIGISVMKYSVLELLKEAFFQHSYILKVAIECESVNPDCKLFFEGANQTSLDCLTVRIPITDNVGIDIERRHKRFEFVRTFFIDGHYHRYDTDLSDLYLSSSELHDDLPNLEVDDERCLKVLANKIIMEKLTGFLRIKDIQSLLKVSSLVRQTIKELKLDFQITVYEIYHEGNGKTSCFLSDGVDDMGTFLQYVSNDQGCVVKGGGVGWMVREKGILISDEYRIRCLKDFAINMEHQKASIECFALRLGSGDLECEKEDNDQSEFIEIFENFFETRNMLIRTKCLNIHASMAHHIIGVLKHIDSSYLENINVIDQDNETQRKFLELKEVCKLEQWKNAKNIDINGLIISTPIQELGIFSFSSGEIIMNTLTTDDMRYLKEGFLASSSLEKFKINIVNCEIDDTVNLIVGWPFRVANSLLRNQRSVWFFLIPNTNKYLHIVYHVPHFVIFRHCDYEDVPEEFFENQL